MNVTALHYEISRNDKNKETLIAQSWLTILTRFDAFTKLGCSGKHSRVV